MLPYKRSDWNGLLSLINDSLQNPPSGCGPAVAPIPLAPARHRWSHDDIQTARFKIQETNSEIHFTPLLARQRWTKALADELLFAVPQMWADCSSYPYCTEARLAAELAANGSWGLNLTESSTREPEPLTGYTYTVDATNAICRSHSNSYGPLSHSIVPRFRNRTWAIYVGSTQVASGSLDEGGVPVEAGVYTGHCEETGASIRAYTTGAECASLPSGNGRPSSQMYSLAFLGAVYRDPNDRNFGLAYANENECSHVIGFAVDGEWEEESSGWGGYFKKVWYITSGNLYLATNYMVEESQTEGNGKLVPGATYYLSTVWPGMITRHRPGDAYAVPVGTAYSERVLTVNLGT